MAREGEFRAALQEWGPLLELLLQPGTLSPVGSASHWLRSRGLSMSDSSSHRTCPASRLWRLVPHLLAYKVALLQISDLKQEKGEEAEPFNGRKRKRTTIGNLMWMQTLPSMAQTNILCFLELEHTLFHSKDLKTLGLDILAAANVDYWVSCAAQSLLTTVGCSNKANRAGKPEHSVPNWLLKYKGQPPLLPWMPIAQPLQRDTVKLSFQDKVNPPVIDSHNQLQKDDVHTLDPSKNEVSHVAHANVEEERDFVFVLRTPPLHSKDHMRMPEELCLSPVVPNAANEDKFLVMGSKPEKRVQEVRQAEDEASSISALAHSLREAWLERQPALDDLQNLDTLQDASLFLKTLEPWNMKDDAILNLTKVFLMKDISLEWTGQISSYCLLPKLLQLEEPASRFLMSAVLEACKAHPRAVTDALLVPLVLSEKGPTKAQCDVLNRVLKECLPDSHIFSFCGKVFVSSRRQHLLFSDSPFVRDSFLTASVIWSEPLWVVLQNALSRPIELDIEALEALVNVCEEEVVKYAKSLKFCNLVLCLLSKYGSRLKPFKSKLQSITELTETFITKTLTTKSSDL